LFIAFKGQIPIRSKTVTDNAIQELEQVHTVHTFTAVGCEVTYEEEKTNILKIYILKNKRIFTSSGNSE
jgi:hypothetical protein